VLRLLPPLIINDEEIEIGVAAVASVLSNPLPARADSRE
jgi:4-aminobutyrate aminotransferase-like enzyme